jgi:hypothetical protein
MRKKKTTTIKMQNVIKEMQNQIRGNKEIKK